MHGRHRQTKEEREQRRSANVERVRNFNALQVRGSHSLRLLSSVLTENFLRVG